MDRKRKGVCASQKLRLRCARERVPMDSRPRIVSATADTALLVRGPSENQFLEEASQGGICRRIDLFMGSCNANPLFFPTFSIERLPPNHSCGHCRNRSNCPRRLDLLASEGRFRRGGIGGKDGAVRWRRNHRAGNLRKGSPSPVCGIFCRNRGGMHSGRHSSGMGRDCHLGSTDVRCHTPGRAGNARAIRRGV